MTGKKVGGGDGGVAEKRRRDGTGGTPGYAVLGASPSWSGGAAEHGLGSEAYGKELKAASSFVLGCQDEGGMLAREGTRMYSHAFATLFLARYYRETRDAALRLPLKRAAAFIWKCQDRDGAWGYAPFTIETDLTVTACQVAALLAARDAGVPVPKENLERALDFVVLSAKTGLGKDGGSFQYVSRRESPRRSRSTFAVSAAGLATLTGAGLGTDDEILAYIERRKLEGFADRDPPRVDLSLAYLRATYRSTPREHYFFYFGNLFAAQAMLAAGGDHWKRYRALVLKDLLMDQQPDGSWKTHHVGAAYATASACLILQVSPRPLPEDKPPKSSK